MGDAVSDDGPQTKILFAVHLEERKVPIGKPSLRQRTEGQTCFEDAGETAILLGNSRRGITPGMISKGQAVLRRKRSKTKGNAQKTRKGNEARPARFVVRPKQHDEVPNR